ncbi:MAG: hypothetical protein ACOCVZ_03420 [Gemmatimonadota bacterium]
MTRVRPLLLLLALALSPAGLAGQQRDELPRLVETLAQLWARGEAGRLAGLGAEDGLDLEIQGRAMGAVTGRRAAAALRQLFGAQQTVAVRHGVVSRVSGAENRAFAELTWEVRPPGAQVTERTTVFVGFVRERSRWRVSQIRILP